MATIRDPIEEIIKLHSMIEHLTEKLNRVEAVLAHNKPSNSIDPLSAAIDNAVGLIETAVKQIEAANPGSGTMPGKAIGTIAGRLIAERLFRGR